MKELYSLINIEYSRSGFTVPLDPKDDFWIDDANAGECFLSHFVNDVEEYPELKKILNQLPFAPNVKEDHIVFHFEAAQTHVPIHIDGGGRLSALIFPIYGYFEGCSVSYYEATKGYSHDEGQYGQQAKRFDNKNTKLVGTGTYIDPILFNSSLPHRVDNPTYMPKIILSIRVGDLTYKEACKVMSQKIL